MKKHLFLFALIGLARLLGLGSPLAAMAEAEFDVLASLGSVEAANPSDGVIEASDGALYGTTYNGGAAGANGYGTVFKLNRDGSGYTVLHNFNYYEGWCPCGGLLEGSDGMLYGTTTGGGQAEKGTVFKINRDGSGYTVLHNFNGGDGVSPHAGLVEGSDGVLYGTTATGGQFGYGTVFRINRDGSGHTVLYSFNGSYGARPYAGLVEASDGAFYGTTYGGGQFNRGTVFKINRDGSGHTVLHNFSSGDGAHPGNGLVEGSDSALYGTTYNGGQFGYGTVFRINRDGTGHTVLHSFNYYYGANPSRLIEASDGALYGTTWSQQAGGTVFKINQDGSGHTVYYTTMKRPSELVEGSDGALYGTTFYGGSIGFGTVFKINRDGTEHTVLHDFHNRGARNPYAALLEGSDGVLYGTTMSGGMFGGGGSLIGGDGTVFKINRDGSGYSIIHNFNCSEGAHPKGRLVQGSDGALYGTTYFGGQFLKGTVFKINRDGSGYTVLHNFNFNDGAWPYAGLVEGSDSVLYGTTYSGGQFGYGTVFRINQDGSGHTVLHNFSGSDGARPYAGLVEASDEALYGTTHEGGQANKGTVFKINRDGSGHTVLHNFSGSDGAYPYAGLVEASDGVLYGTTASYPGTVFKINRDGSGHTVLHNFSGSDGAYPCGGLVEVSDGGLYGTTYGWDPPFPIVFKIDKDGNGFTVVYSFLPHNDGEYLYAGLIEASDGALYGTTCEGGQLRGGVIYRIRLAAGADCDNDGIADNIDIEPTVYSNDFTDFPLGGTSTGSIVNRNGLFVRVDEEPNPAGFRLSASDDPSAPGNGPAEIAFTCAGTPYTLFLDDGASGVVTCGSLTVETVTGVIQIALTGGVVVTVPSTATVRITDQADGTFAIGNISAPASTTAIIVEVNHQIIVVARGDSTIIDSVPPTITCPEDITLPCSVDLFVPATFMATATDNCDPAPTVTYSHPPGSGFTVGTTTVVCTATDASGNTSSRSFSVRRAALDFSGFLSPIGGADATGGGYGAPVRMCKLNSTIPVKFAAACGGTAVTTGIHTLEVIRWTSATTSDLTIHAISTDVATTGNQFRLVNGHWQFNLDTFATGMVIGQWQLVATLSDGSQHKVWIQLK